MNAEQSNKIEKLYREMFERMKIYAGCSLDNESLAEEAVQETFRIACQKPEQLLESKNPQGWLINTLKFTISNIKHSRENAKHIMIKYLLTQADDIAIFEDKISLDVTYEDVADMEEFKLLKEMAVDGRSHLEMAADRGISVNACKKRVQRAKEKLQKKLKFDVTDG